jgi:hypothetical protein
MAEEPDEESAFGLHRPYMSKTDDEASQSPIRIWSRITSVYENLGCLCGEMLKLYGKR